MTTTTWRVALLLVTHILCFLLGCVAGCQCDAPVPLKPSLASAPWRSAVLDGRSRDEVTRRDTVVVTRERERTRLVEVPAIVTPIGVDTICTQPFIATARDTIDPVDGDTIINRFTWRSPEESWFDTEIRHAPDTSRVEIVTREIVQTEIYLRKLTIGPALYGGVDQDGRFIYGAGISLQFNLFGIW